MSNNTVVFIDSGIGGLPYFRWISTRVLNRGLVYIADNANFPYGEKTPETLINLATKLIRNLTARFNPELMVLSCNTLSVVALSSLRKRFSVPLVGVVPAVKPAAENTEKKSIGVIATGRTTRDGYLAELISHFASDCRVYPYAADELVSFIEKKILTASVREKEGACYPSVTFFREKGIDTLVLGCTHFIFLKEVFEKLLGPDVRVMDSVDGVGNQVLRLLAKDSAGNEARREKGIFYITADDPDSVYASYADHFGMRYGGALSVKEMSVPK